MNQRLSFYTFFFLLTVSFALASAGGGAGGKFENEPSRTSSSSGGTGPYFYGLKCFDTGQLTFQQSPSIKPVIVEKDDGTNLTLNGEWEGTTFTSEEAEINEAGNYTLHDPKNGDKTVDCPGLKFSCKLIELNLQECFYEKGKINVTFTLSGKGISVNDLHFQFQKWNSSRFLEYQKGVLTSSELKGTQLQRENKDKYILEVADAPLVSLLKVTYSKCIGKHYLLSKINCLEKEEQPLTEETPKEIRKEPPERIQEEVKVEKDQEKAVRGFLTRVISFLRAYLYK